MRVKTYVLFIFFLISIFLSCDKNKIDKSKLTPEQKELVEKNENKTMKEIIDNLPEEGVWISTRSKNKKYYLGDFIFYSRNNIKEFFESSGVMIKIEKVTFDDKIMHVIFSATYRFGKNEKTGEMSEENIKVTIKYYSYNLSKEQLLKILSRYKKGESPQGGVIAKEIKDYKPEDANTQ
jgi:hypothetical protein